nr:MAG TPA: hypothetical protein [Caudoviricetes sp.]
MGVLRIWGRRWPRFLRSIRFDSTPSNTGVDS